MRYLLLSIALVVPMISVAQVQTKSQCITTVRARSMSISAADAEKLCSDDYSEVVNCAITQAQGQPRGNMEDRLKVCRDQWGLKSLKPTPTPTPSPAVTPAPVKVPTEEIIETEEEKPASTKEKEPVFEPIPD